VAVFRGLRQSRAYRERAVDVILLHFLVNLAAFLVPAAPVGVACAALSRGSRDEWRLLAWCPVLPLALWAPFVAWGVTRDRTSHNLWPFEFVIWAALSMALLALFLIGRRLFGGPRTDWSARRDRNRIS
jgi:hypothetical protein